MRRTLISAAAVGAATLALAACGSGTTITSTSTTTTTTPPTTTTTIAVTRNLVVTASVRQSLVAAAAKFHSLPVSDYLGLQKGLTYYAYDPSTHLYYAAARLVPSPHSYPALVGSQDDGAYNLFTRASTTGVWTVYSDGMGAVQGTKCPVALPAAVLAVWNWTAGSCYPPS